VRGRVPGGTRSAGLRCGPPSSSSALSRGGDLVRGRVPGGTRSAGLLGRRHLTVTTTQRRPIRAVSGSGRESNDRPARASGGLPPCFSDAPWVRSPWIAKHAHCAHRASGQEVDEGHNGVHGTSRPRRWGARVGEVVEGYWTPIAAADRCRCRCPCPCDVNRRAPARHWVVVGTCCDGVLWGLPSAPAFWPSAASRRRCPASPDQRGHLRIEEAVTTLLGRATAYLRASTTHPECAPRGLPSTRIVRSAVRAGRSMEGTMACMARPAQSECARSWELRRRILGCLRVSVPWNTRCDETHNSKPIIRR